ncbi:MAG TPA: VOC family protein [Gaiellaceae bacterium]|nr:VOC family protein [Gaiellaceae bacterium]
MAVTHTFAGLPVADYITAYDWYVRLLGREAEMFPHPTECVWHLTKTSSIYVAQDPERAGKALVTLALDDLDDHERRLREASLAFLDEASGSTPRRLIVSDPDGNRLAFFQDPSLPGG